MAKESSHEAVRPRPHAPLVRRYFRRLLWHPAAVCELVNMNRFYLRVRFDAVAQSGIETIAGASEKALGRKRQFGRDREPFFTQAWSGGGKMKTQLPASLAGNDQQKPMMITTTTRHSLLAAALALFAGGCYSAECEKMGLAEGTPEHARCEHQLKVEMTQQLNNLSHQLNNLSQQTQKLSQQQKQENTVSGGKTKCFYSGGRWVGGSPGYYDPGTEICP